VPYPDATQYYTNSPEWRDICLARWICVGESDIRRERLENIREAHGKPIAAHLERLAREQWEKRAEWLPAHLDGLVVQAARHLDAEAADKVFRDGYTFQTHSQIATEIRPAPKPEPAASVGPPVPAEPPAFELTP
jgi:hypothetical protein